MKIALIGPHSTGKTTVVDQLADYLGLPKITERVREVARSWGMTPRDVPLERLLEFQNAVLDWQIAAERAREGEGFVADRSTIDNMAYLIAQAEEAQITTEDVVRYCFKAYTRLDKYDLLIFVPVMFDLVDDGERHVDPTFQLEIQNLILDMIGDLEIQGWDIRRRVYVVTKEGAERWPEIRAVVDQLVATLQNEEAAHDPSRV